MSDRELSARRFSRAVLGIPEAKSIEINQLTYALRRAQHDVITLSLGEAFFDIPLFNFKALDAERINHYSDSQGLPELRRNIADFYQTHYGARVNPKDEIIISAGSKPLIYMAMQAVLDPGDEVVIHEPAWLSYQEHARLIGATPKFIPFDAPIESFPEYLSDKSRILVVNNPNNPAGRLYSRSEIMFCYKICLENGLYFMVDEAYSDFVLDDQFVSLAEIDDQKEASIVVNSLSKNMGISGWRIGYIISNSGMIHQLLKLNQHLITCAPTILQEYCSRYFDDIISITLPQVRGIVEKRKRVSIMMERIGLNFLPGGSTFYFFVGLGDFPGSSEDFATKLLVDHSIAVVPGSAYGESTRRFIRVAIGTESEERIREALFHIKALTHANKFEAQETADKLKRLKSSL